MVLSSLRGLLGLAAIFGLAGPALAQTPSSNLGQQVYERACAGCHAAPPAGSRASSVEQLRSMSAQTLRTALTTGPMRGVGEGLSPEEMEGVIGYLANRSAPASAGIPAPPMCTADRLPIRVPTGLVTKGWGFDPENTRRLSAAQAGLTSGNLKNLEVAWTMAFPGPRPCDPRVSLSAPPSSTPLARPDGSTRWMQKPAARSGLPKPLLKSGPALPSGGWARRGGLPWWAAMAAVRSRPGTP